MLWRWFVGKKSKKFGRNGIEAEDVVNSPAHYRHGEMETISAIEGLGLGYHAGNIVKYLARYRWKHSDRKGGVQDLRKAAWYLERLIERESMDAYKARDDA